MRRLTLLPLVLIAMVLGASGEQAGSLVQRAPANAKGANPFAGQPEAISAGAKVFGRECSGCHGRGGQGIGKAPSLRMRDVADASAGALFWVLRNGSMRRGMPSFAHLPEPERWQIVTYLQTLHLEPIPVRGEPARRKE
jgi:mono/diheme cytochrome c family protein